jgi:hypothetical protein
MATTLSYQGVLYRSNVFDRKVLRNFAGSSGDANKEFGATLDLISSPLPAFPYAISTQDVKTISFLFLQVIGGAAVIRLVKDGYYTAALNTAFIAGEIPDANIDGVTFTIDHTPIPNTVSVYDNGTRTTDYTIANNVITFNAPPVGAVLVDYYWSPSVNPTPLNTQTIDITVGNATMATGDTLLMTGVDLSRLFVLDAPKGCVIEVFGMGF